MPRLKWPLYLQALAASPPFCFKCVLYLSSAQEPLRVEGMIFKPPAIWVRHMHAFRNAGCFQSSRPQSVWHVAQAKGTLVLVFWPLFLYHGDGLIYEAALACAALAGAGAARWLSGALELLRPLATWSFQTEKYFAYLIFARTEGQLGPLFWIS